MEQENRYWQAVVEKDSKFDDHFYYGVVTTGVYCKPSCKTRTALRKNVKFFRCIEDAQAIGLRACKKCNPDKISSDIQHVVHELCRYIGQNVDAPLSLSQLAKKSGYSAAHLQKNFLNTVGSTPKAYQTALRQKQLKVQLQTGTNVTDAIYGVGFGSPSRVYEKLNQHMGMTPKQYGSGGSGVSIHFVNCITILGSAMIAATERGICFLQFGDSHSDLLEELKREFPKAKLFPMPKSSDALFKDWIDTLNSYLEQKKAMKKLPLDIQGTAFQMLVWRYLQTIPAGETRSYTEVARAINKPTAVRAVANACANNRIAILVPCHRVLRGDNCLAGYRWSLERKRKLLELERLAK